MKILLVSALILLIGASALLSAKDFEYDPSIDLYTGLSSITEQKSPDGARVAFSYSLSLDTLSFTFKERNRISFPPIIKVEMQTSSNVYNRRFQSMALRVLLGLGYQYLFNGGFILGSYLYIGYEYFPLLKAASFISEISLDLKYRIRPFVSLGVSPSFEVDNENFTFLIGFNVSFYFLKGDRK